MKNNTITSRCGTCHGPAKNYTRVTVCSSLRCRAVTPKN